MESLLHQALSGQARVYGPKTALQIKRGGSWERWTYERLEQVSRSIAVFLMRRGYEPGAAAVILLENSPEWVGLYFGILRAGLVCVPLDTAMRTQEIERIVEDCKAVVLFASASLSEQKISASLRAAVRECVIVDGEAFQGCIHAVIPVEEANAARAPFDTAALIYTSGTTGSPKAVMLSHANLYANFASCSRINLAVVADNFLALLPLHHTYPFMVTVLVPLFTGATVTFAPAGFKPEELAALMRQARVTILTGVPQLFLLLYRSIAGRLSHLPSAMRIALRPYIRTKVRAEFGKDFRLAVSGGARLDPEIGRGLKALGLLVVEGYGLTEASPVVSFNSLRNPRYGSAGKAVPGVQIKISNPDSRGQGEILVQGANVMKGYFNHDDWTRESIRDGWLYTGDRGYIDRQGFLYITGREKEVIVLASGKNIYPQELESYYAQSPYIKEICILEKPRESFGSTAPALFAVIVPDLDYFKSQKESRVNATIRWELENLGKAIPSYQHIMGFMLSRDALPRTALNKIQRYKVREVYLEGQIQPMAASEEAYSQEDVLFISQTPAPQIIGYLSEQLKKPVYLDSHLELDLGIDSLMRVELVVGVEQRFGIAIPDETLYDVTTVKDLITRVKDILSDTGRLVVPVGRPQTFTWLGVLDELPAREILDKIRLKTDLIDWVLLITVKAIVWSVLRVFWLLGIRGGGRLPGYGPYLICANHASYLDGLFIFASLPLSIALQTYFVGYARIFEHPLLRWALKRARLIPIDPVEDLVSSLRAVSYVLSQKKVVCIFPEGGRSIDDTIQEFKKGIGILMKELDVRAVAVYIKNSHRSWPRATRLPRPCRVHVTFGALVSWREVSDGRASSGEDEYREVARGLQKKVEELKV